VYSLGVKHVHGGQTKVFGAHDLYSELNWVMLMKNESEAEVLRCIRAYHAYCRSENVDIRHLHTDNFASYLTPAVRACVQNELKAVYTQSPPDTPRSNGTSERMWRTMGNDTRACMQHARLPRNYCWYALRHGVDVRNTLPLKRDPTLCAYKLFTGRTPNVMGFRVWGCVVYAKLMHPLTKMANRAVRCVHLGRAQSGPGYVCYDPAGQRVHISIHCRFVETSTPGLTVSSQGGWLEAVPEYADEFDPDADIVDGLGNPIGDFPTADVESCDEPLMPAAAPPAAPAGASSPAGPATRARASAPPSRSAPIVNEPPASLSRPRRARALNIYNRGSSVRPSMSSMIVGMAALVGALQPGGTRLALSSLA
jgi:hypothetical protein